VSDLAGFARVRELHAMGPVARLGAALLLLLYFGGVGQARDPVHLPAGVNRPLFKRIVGTLRASPTLRGADAVVFYGSRSHKSAGHRALPGADLDALVFFAKPGGYLERADKTGKVNRAFAPVARRAGFPIHEDIPAALTLDEALGERAMFSSHSLGQERRMWRDTLARARSEGWTRDQTKTRYLETRGAIVPKEALIVLRSATATPERLRSLRSLGYRNVVIERW
jgi:hypothetical protein